MNTIRKAREPGHACGVRPFGTLAKHGFDAATPNLKTLHITTVLVGLK